MKTVVFCDDQAGFWLNRSEWQDWPDWRIRCVSNPSLRGGVVKNIIDSIDKLNIQEPFYVVTDANFGAGLHLGGAELLAKLFQSKRIHRGVVYSSEPETGKLLNAQIDSGNACAVKNDERSDLAKSAEIREFLETGKVPTPSADSQIQLLSKAIHRLENLALPLRLDVETLESPGAELNLEGEIWNDYFGSPANGGGFLLDVRTFSRGASGIENEIVRILDSVLSVPKVTEGEMWMALDSAKGFIAETVAKELGIGAARKDPDSLNGKPDALKRTLTEVRDNILALASDLRKLRNHLETNEGGRQS